MPGTQVGSRGKQEGGSWGAEEGLFARGLNQAEQQDLEGGEMERAASAAGLKGAQALHEGSRREASAMRRLEQSKGQGCQGRWAAEHQGWGAQPRRP